MIPDILTVMAKEWRELLRLRGRIRYSVIWVAALLGLFGIVFPAATSGMSVFSGLGLVFSFWVPTIMVTPVVADAFAGERERRTLETLLASRLSSLSILLGKFALALSYGLASMLLLVAISHATALLALPDDLKSRYPPPGYGAWLLVSTTIAFLIVALFAGLGMVVSIKAPTVRQAQQSVGLVVAVLPSLLWMVFLRLSDVQRASLVAACGGKQAPLVFGTGLLLGNVACLAVALLRFRRARLLAEPS